MHGRRVFALALVLPMLAAPLFGQAGMVRSEQAFPTGNRGTSVVLLERMTPAEVRVGSEYTYTIRLTNLTPLELGSVSLTETVGSGLQVSGSEPSASGSGGALSWEWPSLAPRETVEVRITGKASAQVDYCASVRYDTAACAVTKVVAPALALQKMLPAEVTLCDPIPVKLVVTNTGTGVARNVVVTDNLPDGMITQDGRRQVSFNAGNLGAGQSREFTIQAKAERKGSFTNTATATEEGGLSADASASTVVRSPELTLVKNCPEMRFLNRPAKYELTVTNTGDAVARSVVLVDTIPNGIEFASASDGGRYGGRRVEWALGDLNPGDARTVTVECSTLAIGTVRNTARATAYCADADAECVMEVRGIPAILLEVIDLQDPIELGSNETYVIEITNQGSANDTNIRLVCTLPNEQSFVSAQGPTGHSVNGQVITFEPLPTLAPKAKARYQIVIRANAAGDVRFKASMRSDEIDSPVEETESTRLYE